MRIYPEKDKRTFVIKMDRKEKEETTLKTYELIEMYKAGFIDGYNSFSKKKVDWNKISKKCSEGFKKRLLFK